MLSTAEARERGYEIVRGSYQGTSDDRLDRWYIERSDASAVDRRGSGYATRREALAALADRLGIRSPGRPALYDAAMLTRSIVLPESMWRWVDDQAEDAQQSRSAWIRDLIERCQ